MPGNGQETREMRRGGVRTGRKTARICKQLTRRERALFEGVAKGMSITDAARAAGYSQKWPGQAGCQALKNIQQKAPDLFERHGLDDDSFIKNHILPALNATEIKASQYQGRFIYSKPLEAWGPRMAAIRLVAEMKGMIVKERDAPATSIRTIVISAENRPVVRGTTMIEETRTPHNRPPQPAIDA